MRVSYNMRYAIRYAYAVYVVCVSSTSSCCAPSAITSRYAYAVWYPVSVCYALCPMQERHAVCRHSLCVCGMRKLLLRFLRCVCVCVCCVCVCVC